MGGFHPPLSVDYVLLLLLPLAAKPKCAQTQIEESISQFQQINFVQTDLEPQ